MQTPDLCPYGCYWECEHRGAAAASGDASTGGSEPQLRPVEDAQGRTLNRCRECGDYFYSAVEHAREHARKRQLGWLPERLPADWPSRWRAPRGLGRADR